MINVCTGETLGQRDKLINEILKLNKNLRFKDLTKVLTRIGYTQNQPKGGSSHYTFRKGGKMPITLPKTTPMNKVYIEMVRKAIIEHESEAE